MSLFWTLIEESATHRDRAAWIQQRLAARTPQEILAFDIEFTAARRRAETWTMWAAALRITSGHCSGDGFWYFLPWLTGLGRDTFEQVADDPDALAGVPRVRRLAELTFDGWSDDDWPEWEMLNYVSCTAYDLAAGTEEGIFEALAALGHGYPADPEPHGEDWDLMDDTETQRRLPRLCAVFPPPPW